MKVEEGDVLVIFAIAAVVKVISVHQRNSCHRLIVEDIGSKARYSLSGFIGDSRFTLRSGYDSVASTVTVVQASKALSFFGLVLALSIALYFFG